MPHPLERIVMVSSALSQILDAFGQSFVVSTKEGPVADGWRISLIRNKISPNTALVCGHALFFKGKQA
ncbi:MAG: hypothetical protein GXP31_19305 [Kiritimatiellaeota bacterium]|nr:hypothetical protein [Kiritimatiellota bacterium]